MLQAVDIYGGEILNLWSLQLVQVCQPLQSPSCQAQQSGQASSMREGINSSRPRANFPCKILKENFRNNRCLAK